MAFGRQCSRPIGTSRIMMPSQGRIRKSQGLTAPDPLARALSKAARSRTNRRHCRKRNKTSRSERPSTSAAIRSGTRSAIRRSSATCPAFRARTYMPFPFQIVQGSGPYILMSYEYASSTRIIRMNSKQEAPTPSWMGWSRGRWEGDTLVVDVTGLREETWLDRGGDFHSDELHVVERYTSMSPYHLMYEATIEDPKVYTRPWKMSFPLYRRIEKNVQLLEFKCVPFTEELLYGRFRKQPAK